jgi:hypothetical protein
VSRIGLGRRGQLDSEAGDPLDGLVNLFDVGLVLAVAFLIAGLSLQIDSKTGKVEQRSTQTTTERTLTTPNAKTKASGRGQAVGQVYRLPDGRLVLQESKP